MRTPTQDVAAPRLIGRGARVVRWMYLLAAVALGLLTVVDPVAGVVASAGSDACGDLTTGICSAKDQSAVAILGFAGGGSALLLLLASFLVRSRRRAILNVAVLLQVSAWLLLRYLARVP